MRNISILFFILVSFSLFSQNKNALIIGISNYQKSTDKESEWSDIHGTNDALIIAESLKKQDFKTSLLLNHAATAEKIRKKLLSFSNNLHKGDIVYLHFSCHGQPIEDIDGDEEDGWDEAIIPYDAEKTYSAKYTGESHLTDDELNNYYQVIRKKIGETGTMYVVIDACHAGTSYRGEDSVITRGTNIGFSKSGKIFSPSINKQGCFKIQKQDKQGDICLIEACRSYQSNSEIKENGIYYGALSWYINESMKKHNIGSDFSWINEVKKSMDKDPRLIRQNIVIESSK